MRTRQICSCTGDGVTPTCWLHGATHTFNYPAKPADITVRNQFPSVLGPSSSSLSSFMSVTPQECSSCKDKAYQIKHLESWFTNAIAHSGCTCGNCQRLQENADRIIFRLTHK